MSGTLIETVMSVATVLLCYCQHLTSYSGVLLFHLRVRMIISGLLFVISDDCRCTWPCQLFIALLEIFVVKQHSYSIYWCNLYTYIQPMVLSERSSIGGSVKSMKYSL